AKRLFELVQTVVHIFALTNISRCRYRDYIRLGGYDTVRREASRMSDIRTAVQQKYAAIAGAIDDAPRADTGCCAPASCGCGDPITSNLYSDGETRDLPAGAVAASLGCGNPTALAALEPGQTVLDLGSGGGIDVLLSAKRVGPEGRVYGLDMTDEMLTLARQNQEKAGATN